MALTKTQFNRTETGATIKVTNDKLKEFISVNDFGAVGDYSNDDTTAIQNALNAAGTAEKNVYVPAGTYKITETLYIPAGVRVIGEGKYDHYDTSSRVNGTVFKTSGTGNAKAWTDITGSDTADDTPLFVAKGNGVYLENLTLLTDANHWSIGILFLCAKQCGFSGLQTFDFTDGGVYLDATWSDRNVHLTGLSDATSTSITLEPSTGMNEFYGKDFLLQSKSDVATSYGIKIQGSTRDPDSYTSENWNWGWGGASDVVFEKGRTTNLSIDGALKNAAKALQGIRFVNVDVRTGSRDNMMNFDRANRVEFFGGYGEGSSSGRKISLTANTGKLNFIGGRWTDNTIYYAGSTKSVSLDGSSNNFASISNDTDLKTRINHLDYDGNFLNEIITWDDSVVKIADVPLRPAVDGTSSSGISLGTSGYYWQNARIANKLYFKNGGGIDFSAVPYDTDDGSGTSSTNSLLDDYEEGTCQAIIADAATGGNTGSTETGKYTKIGNLVTLILNLNNIDVSGLTSSNDLYIRGLPFVNASSHRVPGSILTDSVNFGANSIPVAMLAEDGNYIRISEMIDNTADDAGILVSEITDDTTDMFISITYHT